MTSTSRTTPPPPDPFDPFAALRSTGTAAHSYGDISSDDPASEPDPFAGIVDEPAFGDDELRAAVLTRAKRTHVPLRKIFVQQPNTSATRPSLLGEFVNGKKLLPLRAFLLIHALEPVLRDTSWNLSVWAKLIGGTAGAQSNDRVSTAMRWLSSRKLITLTQSGQKILVTPLMEDGTGAPFVRASALGADVGHGYFTIPTDFWTTGLADRLKLPGLAMMLVALSETTQNTSFQITQEQMQGWYGLSERTAERGYGELRKEKVLLERNQRVNAPTTPTARTTRVHRALVSPYSTAARARSQEAVRDLLQNTTTAPAAP